MIKIAPSILSADYAKLGEEVRRMQQSGADMIHIDVMDGHFVPNITIGPPIVKSLRAATELPFDVHLMTTHPLDYIRAFAQAGADIISFHVESASSIADTIREIAAHGAVPALTVKPATPVEEVYPYLDKLGMVLVMSVEPGFGGQAFMEASLPKIAALRGECVRRGLELDIQVDGGVTPGNIGAIAAAGANVFVAGNAIFGAADTRAMIKSLRDTARAAALRQV